MVRIPLLAFLRAQDLASLDRLSLYVHDPVYQDRRSNLSRIDQSIASTWNSLEPFRVVFLIA